MILIAIVLLGLSIVAAVWEVIEEHAAHGRWEWPRTGKFVGIFALVLIAALTG